MAAVLFMILRDDRAGTAPRLERPAPTRASDSKAAIELAGSESRTLAVEPFKPATSPAPAQPERDLARIRQALAELEHLVDTWPPRTAHDFKRVDMRPLRRCVLELGIQAGDLRALLDAA